MSTELRKVKLLEPIRFNSVEHVAGEQLEVSPGTAAQLVAAGHAALIAAPDVISTASKPSAKE